MSKKSNIISTIIFTIIFLVGLSVMFYPMFSNWWNSKVQSYAVADYETVVQEMDNSKLLEMIEEANAYNKQLAKLSDPYKDYDFIAGYYDILDVSGTGIMGYVDIPLIQVKIPIYHGTSEGVLQIAAGHLEGSAIPVGGKNTHSVISAHRGLPSAKLFTDLDKLVVGDYFTIHILGQIYTYEVEEILIVEPHEISKLAIIPDGDYVTLMTCTPYGVNSHRMLLRSKRVANIINEDGEEVPAVAVKVTSDAVQVDPLLVVPILASPLVIVMLCFWMFSDKKKKPLPYRNPVYDLSLNLDE
ncbi:MAG: class C sortase [Oscillospiraceae bacterium]|nr:class C sortase [Oscillospiraceae bacterium]